MDLALFYFYDCDREFSVNFGIFCRKWTANFWIFGRAKLTALVVMDRCLYGAFSMSNSDVAQVTDKQAAEYLHRADVNAKLF